MKFVDLNYENHDAVRLSQKAFDQIEKSGKYLLGDNLDLFEKKFSLDQGYNFAVCVKNATDGLYLTFKHIDVTNRTVVVPEFGAYPTIVAAIQAGAKKIQLAPVSSMMTMDIENIDIPNDAVVVPVNLFGNQADVTQIRQVCAGSNSIIVEDCAQSTGIPAQDADYSIHSFYPTKPLGSRGDGGAVLLNNKNDEVKIRKSRFYGLNHENEIDVWGCNSRLDEWQAAFLSSKLEYYRDMNRKRQSNAKLYNSSFRNTVSFTQNCVYHQYVTLWRNRDQVRDVFESNGIPTMIHYPKMLSDMPYLQSFINNKSNKRIADHILSLPVGPHLSNEDVEKVCEVLSRMKNEVIEFTDIS